MGRPVDIDQFETYLERGDDREINRDPSMAKNLFNRSSRKFENMEQLGISERTATDYVENVYESVKMLVQAFMALDGYNPYSHAAIVAYAIDQLDLDHESANRFNQYRKLQNDISYRGNVATHREAREIRDLYEECLDRFESDLKQQLD